MKQKNKIPMKDLAQYDHVQFLIMTEKQANIVYKYCMAKLSNELKRLIKKEKLAKSDKLPIGWTSEVNKIEFDVGAATSKIINKYMLALKWVLLGPSAGKDAIQAAEEVGLKGKVSSGLIQSAYIHSIESHSEHYEAVLGQDAPVLDKDFISASLENIKTRTEKIIDQTLLQLKSSIQISLDNIVDAHNYKALNEKHKELHNVVASGDTITEGDLATNLLKSKELSKELQRVTDSFEDKWDLSVRGDLSTASATGTHQAMLEIYGSNNSNVKVAWIEMEDEKVCSFCRNASKDASGNHKLYNIKDFEPSGYNYKRKKAEWKLTIPPAHVRCRCSLVYVPPGFSVDSDGGLLKNKA